MTGQSRIIRGPEVSELPFSRRSMIAAGAICATFAVIVGLVVVLTGDDGTESVATEATTTTTALTSTTAVPEEAEASGPAPLPLPRPDDDKFDPYTLGEVAQADWDNSRDQDRDRPTETTAPSTATTATTAAPSSTVTTAAPAPVDDTSASSATTAAPTPAVPDTPVTAAPQPPAPIVAPPSPSPNTPSTTARPAPPTTAAPTTAAPTTAAPTTAAPTTAAPTTAAPTTAAPTTAPPTTAAPTTAPPPADSSAYGSNGQGSTSFSDCSVEVSGGNLSSAVNGAPSGAVVCIAAGNYGDQLLSLSAGNRTVKARGQVEVGGVEVRGSNITVDGVRITGRSRLSGLGAAVEVSGSGHTIRNVYVDDAPAQNGIACSNRTSCSDMVFANNSITKINSIGIIIYGRNNRVERNNVWGLVRTTGSSDVDAMRFFGQGHLIRENYFHDINQYAGTTIGGDTPHVDCWQTYTIFESYSPNTNPIVTADVTIENNYCVRIGRQCLIMSNAHTDQVLVRNITFRNNVCEVYDSSVINLQGAVDTYIENNYLGGDPTYQVLGLSMSGANGGKYNRNIVMRNNIIQKSSDRVAVYWGDRNTQGLTVENNHVINRGTQITRSASFESSGNATYPAIQASDFTEFRQQADRGAVVNKGTTAARPHSIDLAGNSRINGTIDIGPYELG
ncbi:MAG: hypothetical protein AAGD35_03310 [Actinomycetota bacterium]